MPCMKDYGKTWDYERGTYNIHWVLIDGKLEKREIILPKYRKIANQYGVIGFRKCK